MTRWDGDGFRFDIPAAKYDARTYSSNLFKLSPAPKSITVRGGVWTDRKPAGVEIYRALVKPDGRRGKWKRIGVCEKFRPDQTKWNFVYKDNTVKAGQAYVYKCRGFIETGNVKKFQAKYSKKIKGVAANAVGRYTCKVVSRTRSGLVLQITGTDDNNGPFWCSVDDKQNRSAWLAYKNMGREENVRYLQLCEYSYDGKQWCREPGFCIRGKESVYLKFARGEGTETVEDLDDIFHYQYVQMIIEDVTYNLCPFSRDAMPQLRINLVTGKAKTGHFIKHGAGACDYVTEWEGGIFTYQIPHGA